MVTPRSLLEETQYLTFYNKHLKKEVYTHPSLLTEEQVSSGLTQLHAISKVPASGPRLYRALGLGSVLAAVLTVNRAKYLRNLPARYRIVVSELI